MPSLNPNPHAKPLAAQTTTTPPHLSPPRNELAARPTPQSTPWKPCRRPSPPPSLPLLLQTQTPMPPCESSSTVRAPTSLCSIPLTNPPPRHRIPPQRHLPVPIPDPRPERSPRRRPHTARRRAKDPQPTPSYELRYSHRQGAGAAPAGIALPERCVAELQRGRRRGRPFTGPCTRSPLSLSRLPTT